MNIRIGIDTGKSMTKYAIRYDGETMTGEFPTTVIQATDKLGDRVLVYKSVRYLVGEPTESSTTEQKQLDKINDTHKICAIVAICEVIEKLNLKDVNSVFITINMPLAQFMDKDDRRNIQEFYNGLIGVIFNDKDYQFNLQVTPYPEGMGLALKHHNKLGQDEVVFLDLGSEQNGALTYGLNKKPIAEQSHSTEGGIDDLKRRIKESLYSSKMRKSYKLSQIEAIINQTKPNTPTEVQDLVEVMVNNHLDSVKANMKALGVDMTNSTLIIGGGGGKLLKPYIMKKYGTHTIVDDTSVFANAIGTLSLLHK